MTSSDGPKSVVSIIGIECRDTINTSRRNPIGGWYWLKRWHILIEDAESPITIRKSGKDIHVRDAFIGKKKEAKKWLIENGGQRFLPSLKQGVSSLYLI